jgi:predicted phosphoribosyltransferase
MAFRDRAHAGRALAARLGHLAGPDTLVLGLARGGVPVAAEVADALGAPFDVYLVRKLGVPGRPELAMGAIATGGVRVVNRSVVDSYRIPAAQVEAAVWREAAEIDRRQAAYGTGWAPSALAGRVVVVVDDGLATGATMRAAVEAVRATGPGRLVVAVPVGSAETCAELAAVVDEVVCLHTPRRFLAVGQWYDDFTQTTDDDIRALLAGARMSRPERGSPGPERPLSGPTEEDGHAE